MKRLIPILLAVSITSHTIAQTSQPPIGHWMMEGSAFDSSGFGNHGTMNNVTSDTGRNGKPNSALYFNGQGNSYIAIPHNNSFNTPEFSICATVKLKDFYAGQCQTNIIFQRGDWFASGTYGLAVYDNAYDFSCNIFDSSHEVFAGNISTNTNASSEHYWQHTPTVEKNKWYSVVFTYDGSVGRVYINGIQKSAIPVYLPVGSSNAPAYIGMNRFGNYSQYPYPFTGWIDDIALYNRLLSLDEIKAYDSSTMAPKAVPPPNTAVNGPNTGNTFIITPQPVLTEAILQFRNAVEQGRLIVYNSIGQAMKMDKISGIKKIIDVGTWPRGQYLLMVNADGQTLMHRLIIQ